MRELLNKEMAENVTATKDELSPREKANALRLHRATTRQDDQRAIDEAQQRREPPRRVIEEREEKEDQEINKRKEAINSRKEMMAQFLVSNPKVASIYERAVVSNDESSRNRLDEMIATRLSELDPSLGQFEVVPKKLEVVKEKLLAGSIRDYGGREKDRPQDRLIESVKETPARYATLYAPALERLYDYVDNGLLDISANQGHKDYLSDDFVAMYAHMVRERHPETYADHKNYTKIRQRIKGQLAGMGVSISKQKWGEAVASAIPFRDEFIEAVASDEETWFDVGKKHRAKVATLMELADESAENYQQLGKIVGLLGTGALAYTKLANMGMTRFWGVSNMERAKNFMATASVELGMDFAYNPHGNTMVLGMMTDKDQSRVLSGIEAIALGTAFNLTIDGMRALKGAKVKDAILDLKKQVGSEQRKLLDLLNKRKEQLGKEVPAKEVVKQPPVEVHVPKAEPISPVRSTQETVVEDIVNQGYAKQWARVNELEEANARLEMQLSPTEKGVKPKDVGIRTRKLERNKELIRAIRKDLGVDDWGDIQAQINKNRLAGDAVNRPPVNTPEEHAVRFDLPEQNLINVDDWLKHSSETAPMRPRERGWSKLAIREGVMHGVAAPMGIGLLGGGLMMSQADENKAGAFMSGMMLPIAPSKTLAKMANWYRNRKLGFWGELGQEWAVPFRSSINRLSTRMGWEVLRHRMRTMLETHKNLETASVFLDHMNQLTSRGVISKAEKELIYNGLDNGNRAAALKAFDIIDQRLPSRVKGETLAYFEAFEKIIRNTWKEADRIGLEMGFVENYFARSISPKMYKKFLEEKGIVKDSRIQNAWKKERDLINRPLTDYEKSQIANSIINTYGYKGAKPKFTKKRKYETVPDHMRKYYDSFEDAQIKYISSMTDAINLHKWLGVGLTKNRLQNLVEEVEVSPGVFDKFTKKHRVPKIGGRYDYRNTIGDKVRRVIEEDNLDPKIQDRLTELLYKRYATPMGRPAPDFIKNIRDLSYMATIGNPYTTLTQISDIFLAASLSDRGMGGTIFAEAATRLAGKGGKTYTLADFGIDPTGLERLLAELGDEAGTTKWLRRNLKATGFSAVDIFGKTALLNATFSQLRKAAQSAPNTKAYQRLVNEYEAALGNEFGDFVNALKIGNKSDDNVMAAVFGRLLDQHPAAMDEMPLGYIKHPNARVMYMLKSFTIKQIDLLRKRTLDQIADGIISMEKGSTKAGKRMVADGVRDMVKYSLFFGGSVMGINGIKDFILGREVSIADRGVDYFAQLVGLQRYHIRRAMRIFAEEDKPTGEAWALVMGFLAPPAASILFDGVYTDIKDFATGDMQSVAKAKTWNYLPIVGRDIFWRVGLGADWERKKRVSKAYKPPSRTRRGRSRGARRSSSR